MKIAFLIAGAIIFILGSGLFLSPILLPDLHDQYSIGGTHDFSAPGQTWRYPDPPLELIKGDTLEVLASSNFSGEIEMYIVSGAGTQLHIQLHAFYHVQTDDLYQVYMIYEPVDMPQSGYEISLRVTVLQTAPIPILWLQVIGLLLILVGVYLIVISFVTARDKIMKESSIWQQKPTDKGVLP
jgi:hypothetical protein